MPMWVVLLLLSSDSINLLDKQKEKENKFSGVYVCVCTCVYVCVCSKRIDVCHFRWVLVSLTVVTRQVQ